MHTIPGPILMMYSEFVYRVLIASSLDEVSTLSRRSESLTHSYVTTYPHKTGARNIGILQHKEFINEWP